MIVENDIKNLRQIPYNIAKDLLEDMISEEIYEKYPMVTSFRFRHKIDDGAINYVRRDLARFSGEMYGYVGIKSLIQNQNVDGFVRDVDLVRVVKSIGHETRHIEQMREIYQKPDLSGYYLDMARMHMIAGVFGSYSERTYAYTPFEIDADLYGFRHAVEYLDKNLVKSDGMPIIDAKACLMQVVEEQPSWRGRRGCSDFESMLEAVECRKFEYQVRDHRDDFHPMPGDNSVKMAAYKHWLPVLQKCKSLGIEQDEILFSAAMDVNPTFVSLTVGLIPEAKRIRKLYPPKCGIVETLSRRIDPSYPVCDSQKQNSQRDVSDMANIPDSYESPDSELEY